MALPILHSTPDLRSISERVNVLIRDYNREDARVPVFALDTGSATAYEIAPVPGAYMYIEGQLFAFKAANANSGTAPTLNVNGLGDGTITYPDGSALAPGDIAANGFYFVQVASTTPTFHLQTRPAPPISNTGATTFLGANVALNNTSSYFNGPNTGSIGANGQTWLITATATFSDTAGAAFFEAAIHNGSSYVAATGMQSSATNFQAVVALSVVVTLSAATTFTLRGRDFNSTSGLLLTTGAAAAIANKATSITAVRLA
jgi:hypothetical protein